MSMNLQDRISNIEVLSRADSLAVSSLVFVAQLRLVGHFVQMPGGRLPKDISNRQLSTGTRKVQRYLSSKITVEK